MNKCLSCGWELTTGGCQNSMCPTRTAQSSSVDPIPEDFLMMTEKTGKDILKELANKKLVETEMGEDRRRYYWINEKGKSLVSDFH